MRLGEIKQKIDRVILENKTIQLKNEPAYNNQAQKVSNYSEIIEVLEYLSTLPWSDLKSPEVAEFLDKYPKENKIDVTLPQEEYNKLNSYVAKVNQKLPIYYSILESMVERQDEKAVNIKLPGNIKTLEDLSRFNARISTMFKSFQVDGQFEFNDFDKGTNWYEMVIVGTLTYPYFIGCLKIAQEYFKASTEYFKSKEAKTSYEAAKKSLDDGSSLTAEKYKENWLAVLVQDEVRILVDEQIKELNGETNESLQTKLVIATTKLVTELGEGTEFHLSLNPPEYAKEQAGQIVIDYRKIPKIEAADKESKQIESPKEGTAEADHKSEGNKPPV